MTTREELRALSARVLAGYDKNREPSGDDVQRLAGLALEIASAPLGSQVVERLQQTVRHDHHGCTIYGAEADMLLRALGATPFAVGEAP